MIKRLLDIIASVLGLLLLAPVFIVIAFQIRRKLGSPVFFRQLLPGKEGKPFDMIKFRTMLDARDKDGKLLPDSVRMTSFGAFLRRTSIDELPELWYVLKGDMSLVGPRPLRMEYLPLYNEQQARRHDVKPGITGWAQINGRNSIAWEDKFDLDIWYVDNRSFLLDMRIIFRTIEKVLVREGIDSQKDVPMPRFTGTNDEGSRK